jgi:hypothetical protein
VGNKETFKIKKKFGKPFAYFLQANQNIYIRRLGRFAYIKMQTVKGLRDRFAKKQKHTQMNV